MSSWVSVLPAEGLSTWEPFAWMVPTESMVTASARLPSGRLELLGVAPRRTLGAPAWGASLVDGTSCVSPATGESGVSWGGQQGSGRGAWSRPTLSHACPSGSLRCDRLWP